MLELWSAFGIIQTIEKCDQIKGLIEFCPIFASVYTKTENSFPLDLKFPKKG